MRYLFGDCELDSERYILMRDGQAVPLRPKALKLLTYLLDHHQRLLSKQALCDQVWQGHFISDSTLESTVREVRRAIEFAQRTLAIASALEDSGLRAVIIFFSVQPPRMLYILVG